MFIAGATSGFTTLASKMNARIKLAYAQKTWKSYKRMFLTFLAFCCFLKIDVTMVEVVHVNMFMEFLCQNSISVAVIRNYLAGISMYFKWFGLKQDLFGHFKVKMMLQALEKSIYKTPKFQAIFNV